MRGKGVAERYGAWERRRDEVEAGFYCLVKLLCEDCGHRWAENVRMTSPATITITSITVEAFELVEIKPRPPVEVRDDEEVTIRLLLKAPAKGYNGPNKGHRSCLNFFRGAKAQLIFWNPERNYNFAEG